MILVRVLQVAVATQRRRFASKVDSHWLQITNESSFQQDVGTVMKGIAVLTPLLGVPWMFGFFVNIHISAAYFFIIVTAFQVSNNLTKCLKILYNYTTYTFPKAYTLHLIIIIIIVLARSNVWNIWGSCTHH